MAEKSFSGAIVDVTYDGAICSHAGECVKGMPTVFDLEQKPWINPATADTPELADQLREVVGRCPSGALQIVEH
jgi:uncharacterized Fe-S cluster protein YjdI